MNSVLPRLAVIRQSRWAFRVLLITGVLAVVLLADATWRLAAGSRDLNDAADRLEHARPILEPIVAFDAKAWPSAEEIAAAREDLSEANRLLNRGAARLAYLPAAGNAFGWLPVWGESLANGGEALGVGRELVAASDRLVACLYGMIAGDGRITDRAYQAFVEDGGALVADLDILVALQPEVARLSEIAWHGPMSPAATYLDLVAEQLDRAEEARDLVLDVRAGLPLLLGYDEPRTILLLGQNDHEVRPTGGFIGTAGIVTVEDGQVTAREFGASYELDPPLGEPRRTPPDEMQRYLGIGEWYIRDTNWSPDFRESAALALQFLEEDQGVRADSVVAVDSHFVALLLGALGPLKVDGFTEPLTQENWFVQAENAIYSAEFGASAAPGDIGAGGANLVANGSFEGIAAGWSPVGSAEVAVTEGGAFGDFALTVTSTGGGIGGAAYVGASNADTGQSYTASVSVRAAGEASLGAEVQIFVASVGGQFEVFSTTTTLTADWQRVSLGYAWETIGHTGWSFTIRDSIGQDIVFEVDGVQVERGDVAKEFEGSESDLRSAVETRSEARQAYLSPVIDRLLGAAEEASGEDVPALLAALQRAAAERHLQLFSPEPAVQQLAARFSIDGALSVPKDGDLLAVVDANVSYNKIQPAISRSIVYLVRDDGVVDILIRWKNDLPNIGPERYARLGRGGQLWYPAKHALVMLPGTYGSFTRLYLPPGAVLIGAQGFEQDELHLLGVRLETTDQFTIVGGRVAVPPGQEVVASVSYRLQSPPEHLTVWRQGGFASTTVKILLNQGGQQVTLFDGPLIEDFTLELRAPDASAALGAAPPN